MSPTTLFDLENLKPKFLDQSERFNNWYFTVHFPHAGRNYMVKLHISEGSLLGQCNYLAFSHAPLALEQEDDVTVLRPSPNDFNLIQTEDRISFDATADQVTVQMGELTALCRADQRRIISTHPRLSADLTYTPRGPIFYWGHAAEAVCPVTEATRVSGCESMSNVTGTITLDGQEMQVEGRGLFERVWFGQLSFFQIRVTDWLYAHFDEMYVYLCRTESVTGEGRPFHFETGEAYLIAGDDFMQTQRIEITPDKWVFLHEARRFVPIEQTFVVRTDKGVLKCQSRVMHYPQFIQQPARLENLIVDNVPGWSAVFYDAPVVVEGKFTYKDGRTIKLNNGCGVNEQIRIGPL